MVVVDVVVVGVVGVVDVVDVVGEIAGATVVVVGATVVVVGGDVVDQLAVVDVGHLPMHGDEHPFGHHGGTGDGDDVGSESEREVHDPPVWPPDAAGPAGGAGRGQRVRPGGNGPQ